MWFASEADVSIADFDHVRQASVCSEAEVDVGRLACSLLRRDVLPRLFRVDIPAKHRVGVEIDPCFHSVKVSLREVTGERRVCHELPMIV